jgi:thioredoxin reductase
MTQSIITEVAVVAAAPVGLFAVFECRMLNLSRALAEVDGNAPPVSREADLQMRSTFATSGRIWCHRAM